WAGRLRRAAPPRSGPRRAGVSVAAIRTWAFALCSATAGLGGILLGSFFFGEYSTNTAEPGQLVLYSVAASVIGGGSPFGGRGEAGPGGFGGPPLRGGAPRGGPPPLWALGRPRRDPPPRGARPAPPPACT